MKKRSTRKVKPGPSSTWSTPKISTGEADYSSYKRTRVASEKIHRIADAVSFKKTY